MDYIFSESAIHACTERHPDDSWYSRFEVPNDGSWGVLSTEKNNVKYLISQNDSVDSVRIVLFSRDGSPFHPAPMQAWRSIFQRIPRIVHASKNPPFRLPVEWSLYHEGNLNIFFATPWEYGAFQWVLEIGPNQTSDLCFWTMVSREERVELRNYERKEQRFREVMAAWPEAFEDVTKQFVDIPSSTGIEPLQDTIDLDSVTYGAVTRHRNYSEWVGHLSVGQKTFLDSPTNIPMKLRGPAGSGKTLVLELKALRELYSAREKKENVRILFATHSWAMADQVDAGLHAMDESGDISEIDVFPLLEIASAGLPSERASAGYGLLGEDNLSGKTMQLRRIDEILEGLVRGDWLAYQQSASAQFRIRVDADRGSTERSVLVWDLMNEFSSVLSASGILPGINAERRYLEIQRTPWMMPLETDSDKRFVLSVYTHYVAGLKGDSLLSSDQLVNDYLNYLETFTWNLLRPETGYDLIFVDELHLFDEQERLVLHYLTKNPDEYPRMLMALDPRQSPTEAYFSSAVAGITTRESGSADSLLGQTADVRLSTIHRFTPEILNLVAHINRSFPAIDLGPDWEVDMNSVKSSVKNGALPILYQHRTRKEEIHAVLERVANSEMNKQTAVILLDPLILSEYSVEARSTKVRVVEIMSRNDVDHLRYSKRGVVLGAAEYLGGLQFDSVIVAGFLDSRHGLANAGYLLRRNLSLLYLAISRSCSQLELHVCDEIGGVPPVLESAIDANIILRQD